MEQIISLWPGHGYGPVPSQQSFLSIPILLFSMAKIGVLLWQRSRKGKIIQRDTCFLRSLSHGEKGKQPTVCLSYKDMDHKEMLLSPPSDLLAQGEGGVLSHTLLLLASFRTFQLSNLTLHTIFYGHSCLTFQFPEQVHLVFSLWGERGWNPASPSTEFMASCEESAWRAQPNQDLLPSIWPDSEPYWQEHVMGIQS